VIVNPPVSDLCAFSTTGSYRRAKGVSKFIDIIVYTMLLSRGAAHLNLGHHTLPAPPYLGYIPRHMVVLHVARCVQTRSFYTTSVHTLITIRFITIVFEIMQYM
jgi:hypothetical protein